MPIVDGTPPILHRFFAVLAGAVREHQRRTVVALVLVYAITFGKRNLLSIYQQVALDRIRQRICAALNNPKVRISDSVRATAKFIVEEMQLPEGEEIFLILDPTKKAKRGKKMQAAHWFHDSSSKRKVWGHQFAFAALRVRGRTIPWAVELFAPRSFCDGAAGQALGLRYRSLQKISADMIGSLPAEWRRKYRIIVLFDSALFVKPVLEVVEHLGLTYVSRAQSNRAFWPEGWRGRKTHLESCRYQIHLSDEKRVRIKSDAGTTEIFRAAYRDGKMRDAEKVRVVFSCRDRGGKIVCLVTNDRKLSPIQILETYAQRWWIEVLFKQLKGLLGFGDYQTRHFTGVWNHASVVALAHQQLTFLGVASPEKTRRRAHEESKLPRIAALQDRLRSLVSFEKVEHLLREVRSPSIREKLGALFRVPQQLLRPMRV